MRQWDLVKAVLPGAVCVCVCVPHQAASFDNGAAHTPVLGWSTWNVRETPSLFLAANASTGACDPDLLEPQARSFSNYFI